MIKKPNIVYVFPDEFRQQSMGFTNEDPVITPRLDEFAKESLYLKNAFSNYPVCSPYRGMMFTGQYPWSNGVVSNCHAASSMYGVYLKERQKCLTDILSENGYQCGYIGKWHLDAHNPNDYKYLERKRGDGRIWDAYTRPGAKRHGIDFWYSYGCCDKHFTPHYWMNDDKLEDVRKIDKWSVEHETDVAVDYILNKNNYRDENNPFCLFVAYNPPHMPFEEVPEKYVDMYKDYNVEDLMTRPNAKVTKIPEEVARLRDFKGEEFKYLGDIARKSIKNYFAAVTGVDDNFGRILDALKNKGIEDDTIVIFTSDHGEMMGSHGLMYKDLWYNESLKVPFLIRYKGHIEPGTKDLFMGAPDIMPTICSLVGIENNMPDNIEGTDCSKSLIGDEEGPDEGFYIAVSVNARGIKNDKYTFVVIRNAHGDEEYILYDDINDPYQNINIAYENQDIIKKMREKLEGWLIKTNDVWIR